MIIKHCKIANFGKLSNFEIDFTEGQNTICKINGWGKSTLSAFLRSMFYGLDESKRDGIGNERKRYTPWQGGTFGGNIVFSVGDKEYLITKVFGKKKSEDIFELRDNRTNLIVYDYSENIGTELFGVDRNTFQKTIFIAQNDIKTESTDNLNAKLNTGDGVAMDIDCYEAAEAMLKQVSNATIVSKKGSSGYLLKDGITKLTTEISRNSENEANLAMIERECELKKERIIQLTNRQNSLLEQQKEISKRNDMKTRVALFSDKKEKLSDSEKDLEACQKVFPGQIPTDEQIEDARKECSKYEAAKASLETLEMLPEQMAKYSELELRFSEGTPTKEEVDNLRNIIKKRNELSDRKKQNSLTYDEKTALDEFVSRAGDAKPSDIAEEISEYISRRNDILDDIDDKEKELSLLENELSSSSFSAPKKAMLILGVIAIALAICAIVAGFFGHNIFYYIAAGVICIIGIVLLAVYFSAKNKNKAQQIIIDEIFSNANAIRESLFDQKDSIKLIEEKLSSLFACFDEEYNSNSSDFSVQRIYRKADDLDQIMKKNSKNIDIDDSDISKIDADISSFFDKYNIATADNNEEEQLSKLLTEGKDYEHLKEKYENYKKAASEFASIEKKYKEVLDCIDIIDDENVSKRINELAGELSKYQHAKEINQTAKKELEDFVTQHPEVLEYENDIADESGIAETSLENISVELQNISDEIDDCRRDINNLGRNIESLQNNIEEIEGKKIELSQKQSEYERIVTAHRQVDMARDFLKTAKENLTSRYTGPLMNSFKEYYEIITGSGANSFYMDANTKITVEEQGMQRNTDILSFGYQDLISVCQRFSYIDAMYDDELPFLVLDDPFVNLDGANLEGAKRLLSNISQKYQVLYFTCHEDRVPAI